MLFVLTLSVPVAWNGTERELDARMQDELQSTTSTVEWTAYVINNTGENNTAYIC